MKGKLLSVRLEAVAALVPKAQLLVDIGSDHAYLPVALVERHWVQRAICGEVAQGPWESSHREIEKMALTKQIDVRLGDGLDILSPADRVEVVTIAGMGGLLIRDILNRAAKKGFFSVQKPTLVLQANNHREDLRYWLARHAYAITDERLVRDRGKYYVVLQAKPTPKPYSLGDEEALFGSHIDIQQPQLAKAYYEHLAKCTEKIISSLRQSQRPSKMEEFLHHLEILKARIKQLEE